MAATDDFCNQAVIKKKPQTCEISFQRGGEDVLSLALS